MRSRLQRPHSSPGERLLAVDEGQIVCPRRGLVDIEACWICPSYRGMSSGRVEGLLCATESTLLRSATSWLPTGTR